MVIKPDQSKSYQSFAEALEDNGFVNVGRATQFTENDVNLKEVFEKENELYYISGHDHFNTTIYSVELKELDELSDHGNYEYDLEMY